MDVVYDQNPQRSGDKEGDYEKGDINQDSKTLYRFRNYSAQTNFLDGLYTVDKAEPCSITEFIEEKIKLIDDSDYLASDEENKYKINSKKLNLQKVDSDLKRRIEGRLEKLENETRRQINKHLKSQKSRNK